MNAFIDVWLRRLKHLGAESAGYIAHDLITEEDAKMAESLLTMAIRALDYAPPVDINFPDFLSALLTDDKELYSDDTRRMVRTTLMKSFRSCGINPASGSLKRDGARKHHIKDLR